MKTADNQTQYSVAVVIPSYKVTGHILEVISKIGKEVANIYVIDDACPSGSGRYVENCCPDKRVKVIYLDQNEGVGGAVMAGYAQAITEGAKIIVKIDGDGQMDPCLIPSFIYPILSGHADYTKGNRFFDLEQIREMPPIRIFGNAALSFLTKLSSGYWNIFDPTNGYTAIHADIARHLPLHKISKRYFFETDILFRLNTIRACVIDVPMNASYGEEVSNLRIRKILVEFLFKHIRNFFKRIFYNYYLRDLTLASIELPLGIIMLSSGIVYGAISWVKAAYVGAPTPAGTVMMSALPILMGTQLILAFLSYDIESVPKYSKHKQFSNLPNLRM